MNMFFKAVLASATLMQVGVHATDCLAVSKPPAASSLVKIGTITACTSQNSGPVPVPAPTPATSKAPTTPTPTTPAPTTPAPATPAPTTLAPTKPATTAKPTTTPKPTTTCPKYMCTTITATTTNTSSTTTTTTGTSTNTTTTSTATATTTNTTITSTTSTTTTTTATSTNTTTITATTTNTTTVVTTVTTTNTSTTTYTYTSTNTTGTTTVTTTSTTNSSSLTTATTTNTTTVTTVTGTSTNTTTETTTTTTSTRDPCLCYTTTAASRRLSVITPAPEAARRLDAHSTGCKIPCVATAGDHVFAADSVCDKALAANTTATCMPSALNTLYAKCMPKFDVECPANNKDATMMPYVVAGKDNAQPNLCKACGVAKFAADSDKDPRSGYFWTTVKWGRNAIGDGFDESMITGYEIQAVDALGRVVGDGRVRGLAKSMLPLCCSSDTYSVTIEGSFVTDKDGRVQTGFMIVPYQTVNGKEYLLPIGSMTNTLTDVVDGAGTMQSQKVSASNMSKVDAELLANNPDVKDIFLKAIAKSLDGVTELQILIEKIVARQSSRRLATSEARRLADDWQVDCDYKVILPAGAAPLTIASIDTAVLKTAIEAEALKQGMVIKVGDIGVATPTAPTVLAGNDPVVTGAARPMAGTFAVSSFLALAAALMLA